MKPIYILLLTLVVINTSCASRKKKKDTKETVTEIQQPKPVEGKYGDDVPIMANPGDGISVTPVDPQVNMLLDTNNKINLIYSNPPIEDNKHGSDEQKKIEQEKEAKTLLKNKKK